MFRMRLMTAGAAAALLMAPAAMAQDQTATPPNVGEVPETEVTASQPVPNPGEDSAAPATGDSWEPETPGEDAVAYEQADEEGWSEPEAPADAVEPEEALPAEPEPVADPAPMAEPEPMAQPTPDPMTPDDAMTPPDGMEPPADTTIPPPPIDPAPDAAEDDLMDPTPPGA
ncbi:MAG: hypothetical protein ACK4FB_14165 [Brevundimonas sp.]|uniref:hypothetical protein n=1 Tax=Brevundimonas sp. TaxID=1871086 RepID=UPI00391DD751